MLFPNKRKSRERSRRNTRAEANAGLSAEATRDLSFAKRTAPFRMLLVAEALVPKKALLMAKQSSRASRRFR